MNAPCATIDVSDMRLGDRMAATWWAQHRHLHEGVRFALIDDNRMLREPFPLARFFPRTFVELPAAEVAHLPHWDTGNLWLTVTNVFAKHLRAGHFEHLPAEVLTRKEQLNVGKTRPRVLMHQLNDATYNRARNWHQGDADKLVHALEARGLDVHVLNPSRGQFLGGYDEMLAQMLAADAFVGGDTGPSHVWSMLCASKPQLALYPSMARDRRQYAALQRELQLPVAWDSRPKRPDLIEMTLRPSLRWWLEGRRPRCTRAGRFDVARAADLVVRALAGDSGAVMTVGAAALA